MTTIKLFLSLLGLLVISACGSGGSSDTVSQTPPPANTDTTTSPPPEVITNSLQADINARQAIAELGTGINLGNTLDAPYEGDWALAAQESYIQAFKEAGFGHVRVPVTWHNHVQQVAPYQIDETFLDRVEQVIDWGLERDLYVIVNAHHDDWLEQNYSEQNRQRLEAIWMQIAERFKHKSAKLLFEILNEPFGLTQNQLDQVNQRIYSIIRNQTDNRLIVFAGNNWSDVDALLAATPPASDENYLIGNFHNYDPWHFAGQCIAEWGSNEDEAALEVIYQKAYEWGQQQDIPVTVNEFGSAKYDFQQPENICVQSQREHYLATHIQLQKQYNIPGTFWDDGGSFSTYDRATNSWGAELSVLISQ